MKKSIVFPLSIAAAFIIGCGGGGSSSTASTSVSGTVEASYLAGVKVCEANTTNCAITDAQGRFTLPGVSAPATLEVKVGNTVVGNVNATSNTVTVTPAVLADGNASVASYIGATLHTIGGCQIGATDCNLSGVQDVVIDPNMADEPLVKVIATKLSAGDKNITCTVNNTTTVEVTDNNATLYQTINPDMSGLSTLTYHGVDTEYGTLFTMTLNTDTMQVISNDLNLSDTLQPLDGNYIFDLKNDSNQYVIANKDMFLAPIDVNNQSYFIAGLQYPDYNISTVLPTLVNKEYIGLDINSSGSVVDYYKIDVNCTNYADMNGTWTETYSDGTKDTGTWKVVGDHFVFYPSGGGETYVYLKPGKVRNEAIVTYQGSSAISFAVESKALEPGDIDGEYKFVTSDNCMGTVDFDGTKVTVHVDKCGNTDENKIYYGNVTINNFKGISVNGAITIKTSDGDTYAGIISPEDGYFVLGDLNDSSVVVGINENSLLP